MYGGQIAEFAKCVFFTGGEITVVKVVVMGGDGILGMEVIGIEETTGTFTSVQSKSSISMKYKVFSNWNVIHTCIECLKLGRF